MGVPFPALSSRSTRCIYQAAINVFSTSELKDQLHFLKDTKVLLVLATSVKMVRKHDFINILKSFVHCTTDCLHRVLTQRTKPKEVQGGIVLAPML